jgi:hypothetical protein
LKFYHGAADSLQFNRADNCSSSRAAWIGFAEICDQIVGAVYLEGGISAFEVPVDRRVRELL